MVVVDAVDRHATETADRSKTRGTKEVPTIVDPPKSRGESGWCRELTRRRH